MLMVESEKMDMQNSVEDDHENIVDQHQDLVLQQKQMVVEQMMDYQLDVQTIMDEEIMPLVEKMDYLDENHMLLDQMESMKNQIFK